MSSKSKATKETAITMPEALIPEAMIATEKKKSKKWTVPKEYTLALGSGSARGIAHGGVLRFLKEHNSAPQFIAGTSMGAIFAALYAGGDLDGFMNWATSFDYKNYLDVLDPAFPRNSLLYGEKGFELLDTFLHVKRVEDCYPPIVIVSTDIGTGKEYLIKKGNLIDAIKASTAIPGIFPVRTFDGRQMQDGALVNPVPISICKELYPDLPVLAVDVTEHLLANTPKKTNEADENITAKNTADTTTDNTADEKNENIFAEYGKKALNTIAPILGPKAALISHGMKQMLAPKDENQANIFDNIIGALMIAQDNIKKLQLENMSADKMLSPNLEQYTFLDIHHSPEMEKIGYAEAKKHLHVEES